MSKSKVHNTAFAYPMPMTLVGAMVDGRPNFLAVAWVTRANNTPPMVAVALGKPHYTNHGIREAQAFSVNVPGVGLVAKTDYCGLVSGRSVDKALQFTVFPGEVTGAPLIEECHLCIECRLVQVVELPVDDLFIGEIVGTYADEACLTDDKPDLRKVNPFLLLMSDDSYCRIGPNVGRAWHDGKMID